jgi:ribosomal-protein-alanine N-acetyltransferase
MGPSGRGAAAGWCQAEHPVMPMSGWPGVEGIVSLAVMDLDDVRLRPLQESDLGFLCRFDVEPGLIGNNWYGFRDANRQRRRFEADGWLGDEDGKLIVAVHDEIVGFVGWTPSGFLAGRYREIGVALLPEWRGRGVGTRAQLLLCRYLFAHTAVHRIEARTQPENEAEQRALLKIGFRQDGVLRGAEFRDGSWRDVVVFGLLRDELPSSP